ncbi:PVC-type heme-binding CxxCH protein [Verrucomicrobium spinosum]|uniref:PVC-type heme-binding CxxCH protein n=2 Tax=Verrucomicrobium spinosum TaxID=2736 RepID=UPI0001745AE6|nr:PVC-type heme-binding CxxCH protein [Verrucomicrobium spinosum]
MPYCNTLSRIALLGASCLTVAMALPVFATGDFPVPPDNQPLTIPFPTAEESLKKLNLPQGFKATLFAAEPDVNNPIACCWDEKGRLWVAENFTYSDTKERYDMKLRDRILIFEDTDNDGKYDKRTVFSDEVQMLTSIERGLGGVWAVCPPHLLFIPDKDGDDKPDGPPQVMLDGFSTQAASRHTFANGLKWGPDGWLYGRCGISSTSYVGTPETPVEKRQGIAGGLWRYQPGQKKFEIVCYGTTNPWGHDWTATGDLIFINTVIGHLWHGIDGAHLKRMHGQDLNPRAYQLMDQIADHYHWDTGKSWTDSRGGVGVNDQLGGGHAHVGMILYQGTNWPKEYRDKVMTLNLHGRRINVERLERQGSTFVGKHEPDILKSDDTWFRGVELTYGPDGGVYILDWSDIGECHENDGVHRNSGRIFKVTYGDAVKPKETDVTKLSDEELVKLQLSDNEWLVRMARWELRERAHRGKVPAVAKQVLDTFKTAPTPAKKLNAWWTMGYAGLLGADSPAAQDAIAAMVAEMIKSDSEFLRRWVLQSITAEGPTPRTARILASLAKEEDSAFVRLHLASALGRLADAEKPALANQLLSHADDAKDAYLPLMYWYGIMDMPPAELAKLEPGCQIPLVRQFIARRCTEDIETNPAPLNTLLGNVAPSNSADILQGMTDGLKGWAKAKKPAAWDAFAAKVSEATQQEQLRALSALFGDGRALDDIKKLVLDDKADFAARRNALQSLIAAKADGLREVCEKLLKTRDLNMTAVRGLALYDDLKIGESLAKSYRSFYPNEQPAVMDTLTSRANFAKAMLKQVGTAPNQIPRKDITPYQARQMRSFKDAELDKQLTEVWGDIRESSADKQQLIAALKGKLTKELVSKADASAGRVIFNQVCAACHKLYGEGNLIGPDLTGSGRKDVNYLIENIADPSATLAADYKMSVVNLKDGRILSGNIAAKTDRTLTIKMVGQEQVVERGDITSIQELPVSLMPEGLLLALTDEQVRNLMAYLTSDSQVALPGQ